MTARQATTDTRTTATGRGRPQWLRSVRTRIVVVILLLTSMAMAGAGVIVYALESERIEQQAREQVEQEIAELRALKKDPDTGRPFADVETLLRVFVTRNVPDEDEMFIGYAEGKASQLPRDEERERLLDDAAYEAVLARLLVPGGSDTIAHPDLGEVWVTVVPITTAPATDGAEDAGALVLVTFLDVEQDKLDRTMRTYAGVAAIGVLLIAAIAAVQSGRLLSPLRRLRETAEEIGETDLDRRIPESGNDDLTALTRTFNHMLDRLQASFVGQRQFLDDAGHELKTPLTVLRGHLELLDPRDPDDVSATRELLLEEVDRMGRLVGDLILLAKSRRPDFLDAGPVNLERLTQNLVAKARGLAERDWRLDAAGRGVAVLDEQRITQAVLQLADNAVKHTDPGDTVAIGSSYDGRMVRIWVRDTGPGVPEADRERVFERFGRGAVRSHDEGFGLGLSIVRAIADAHGGTVHIEDAHPPGPPGAVFVITLPQEEQ